MRKNLFKNFFDNYSKNVDNADKLGFWKLSDSIILEIIRNNIPKKIEKDFILLDAGGGTGRWIIKLSKLYPFKFILYDLSESMLDQAKINIQNAGIKSNTSILCGDLCNMHSIKDNSVNFVTSIYNPLSFINHPEDAINELFRITKKGGKILIMAHGYHNAISSKINNYIAGSQELKHLQSTSKVKWSNDLPYLLSYSKESLELLLSKSGFTICGSYGVPVFIQPGPEDWDPKNNKLSRVSKALKDEKLFKTILNLEMDFNSIPSIINRGMNILTVAKKV